MTKNYTNLHKMLHWLSAMIILWALTAGFYASYASSSSSLKDWMSYVNISLTTMYIPVYFLRVYVMSKYYRAAQSLARTVMDYIAVSVHILIHPTVGVVLASGILMMDHAINIWGIFSVPQPLKSKNYIEVFFTLHIWACIVLTLLVPCHIAAVVIHEASGRRLLKRMLPEFSVK